MVKTFEDIEFGPHPHDQTGKAGRVFFDNGYGVSVVRFKMPVDPVAALFNTVAIMVTDADVGEGYGSYTRNEDEWELAVLKGTADSWDIDVSTHVTDDVLGNLSQADVTAAMLAVQDLPPAGGE